MTVLYSNLLHATDLTEARVRRLRRNHRVQGGWIWNPEALRLYSWEIVFHARVYGPSVGADGLAFWYVRDTITTCQGRMRRSVSSLAMVRSYHGDLPLILLQTRRALHVLNTSLLLITSSVHPLSTCGSCTWMPHRSCLCSSASQIGRRIRRSLSMAPQVMT